jgi:hypothetical protein
MPLFQIAYWAHGAASWRPFTGAVEAESPREAIEKVDPPAAGRYRVVGYGPGATEGVFRVSLARHDRTLIEAEPPHLRALRRPP